MGGPNTADAGPKPGKKWRGHKHIAQLHKQYLYYNILQYSDGHNILIVIQLLKFIGVCFGLCFILLNEEQSTGLIESNLDKTRYLQTTASFLLYYSGINMEFIVILVGRKGSTIGS